MANASHLSGTACARRKQSSPGSVAPAPAVESNGHGHVSAASESFATATAIEAPMEVAAGASQLLYRGIDWPCVVWIGMVHVLALVAPFYFSWQGLVACAILIVLTGAMGVCMGYHRCLTHGAFKTYRPVRWLLAFLGGLSGEGSVLTWVANHRKHHHFSDKEGDPHSPRDGTWWSHMLWFMPNFG
jgi:fatty-acid desaturase